MSKTQNVPNSLCNYNYTILPNTTLNLEKIWQVLDLALQHNNAVFRLNLNILGFLKVIFNERAARCSHSTSWIGCVYDCPTCSWATSKSNYYGFRMPNWLKFSTSPAKPLSFYYLIWMCVCLFVPTCSWATSKSNYYRFWILNRLNFQRTRR